ncbi:PIN domain-containing protein [Aetokthonos hydrillicola]|nr:PIN domain-containing protein [Aetokthonos hydrillicola]MBO3460268.1 PIN domain-containing protein [Aetokthonos hydrillicola CCALA 1050]MBW4587002.1 PIN domain-containing protein [Aetokthonos hydrillicola CCALA 1050]
MSVAIALLDGCVLYPAPLRDFFMRLATTGSYQLRWSAMIHDEWIRNVRVNRPDLSLTHLERTRALMDLHVEDALVEGYETIIPTLSLPDADDRHVLAAAIVGQCDTIITFNLKDFPQEKLAPYRIEAVHPDVFVMRCIEVSVDTVYRTVLRQQQALTNPTKTLEEVFSVLEQNGLRDTVRMLRAHHINIGLP